MSKEKKKATNKGKYANGSKKPNYHFSRSGHFVIDSLTGEVTDFPGNIPKKQKVKKATR